MNVLNYKGYQAKIEFDAGLNVLTGTVLNLSDVVVFQCTEISKVQQEFEAAVDDYFETCEAIGKKPEKAFSGSFNIRIGPDLHRKCAMMAAELNKNINQIVQEAITSFFERNNQRVGNYNIQISSVIMQKDATTRKITGESYNYPSYPVGLERYEALSN